MEQELAGAYEIQTQKLSMGKDCQQAGKVLNRIIRCTTVGWEIEADPRHAELVFEQLGIVDKGVSTPGVSGSEEEDEDDDGPLVGEDITRYRGVIARCNYMATDRPDSQSRRDAGKRANPQPDPSDARAALGDTLRCTPDLSESMPCRAR